LPLIWWYWRSVAVINCWAITFLPIPGERLPGLGVLDVYTIAGKRRMIGNIVIAVDLGKGPWQLVGFENHSGRTFHGPGVQPLGRVLVGYGDNGQDRKGGAIYRNTFGCYLHGALLPKNPQLTDHLIELALRRRYGTQVELAPLPDERELTAQRVMVQRLLSCR
jgi:Predicted glutamine amidotransferase